MKVLIIEDEQQIIDALMLVFKVGWPTLEVVSTKRGNKGIDLVETENPDIIILDLGLPDIDGYDVIKQIRFFSSTPILVLTVKNKEQDVVRALELGANEFISKPYRQFELLSRIKNLIRNKSHTEQDTPIIFGALMFDHDRRLADISGRKVYLTCTENLILNKLIKESPNLVTSLSISKAIYGEEKPESLDAIKVHIRHLREKIEEYPSRPIIILTRSGVGYYAIKPV
jgi:two-component system KDP operon response regulator KdpE